ncbi:MAG: DUF1726 domain-containing protein, partial [Thermoplasmata archaeon]|nr:DUF1726 domain-containing protein [Thermoplasmata archaeon]
MLSEENFKKLLLKLKEEAERSYQRRLLAHFGEREKPLMWTLEFLLERSEGGLVLSAEGDLPGIRLERGFTHLPHKETEKILGRTYPNLIMDLTENLVPNDLGRAVGLIRGGGVVVLLFPPKDEFFQQVNIFQRNTLPPPFTEEEVRHYFSRWVYKTLLE